MELVVLNRTQGRTVNQLANDYVQVAEQMRLLEEYQELLKSQLLAMIPDGEKHVTVDGFEVKHVVSQMTSYDEVSIQANITPKMWNTITKKVIDRNKLRASGIANLIARFTTVTPRHSLVVSGGGR